MCRECPSGTSYSQLIYLLEINCYPPPGYEFKEFFQTYVFRYEIGDISPYSMLHNSRYKTQDYVFFKIGRAVEKK